MKHPRPRSRLAIGAILGLLVTAHSFAEEPKSTAMPRLRVSADSKRFEHSGKPFIPWRFNYLGKFEHLAEDDWDTPEGWKRIETDFREMRKLGANVVRWHLQFETFRKAPDQVDAGQLARLKKLLDWRQLKFPVVLPQPRMLPVGRQAKRGTRPQF